MSTQREKSDSPAVRVLAEESPFILLLEPETRALCKNPDHPASPFKIAEEHEETRRSHLPQPRKRVDSPFRLAEEQPPFEAAGEPFPMATPLSSPLPQLELRAIFGVDHEMTENEILR